MGTTKDKLIHRIVYWAPTGSNKAGQPAFEDPVEMAGRWVPEEKQIATPTGTVITTVITVWTERPVQRRGVLLKGILPQVTDLVIPLKNAGAYTVQKIAEHETVDGTDFVYLAYV